MATDTRPSRKPQQRALPFRQNGGRGGLFVVGESAAKLVLMRGDVRGREVMISPDPDRTTTVQ